jgi:toxin YoeB
VKNLEFDPHAFEDLSWWIANDRSTALKIVKLIEVIMREPEKGQGKPEKLRHDLSGCWSRRINKEHRIIYQILPEKIKILACRYHYKS